MTNIADNIKTLKEYASSRNVELVVVSKKKSSSEIMKAYDSGQRIFGENIAQELVQKKDLLPADIQWHFIGHLQRNKVKYIASFISMIQSVDSLRLMEEIQKQAENHQRVIPCLLEIRIADEITKNGMSYKSAEAILAGGEIKNMKNLKICGLMGIGTFTNDEQKTRQEFRGLAEFFRAIKNSYFAEEKIFSILSMGMSDDYKIAIEEGSTMVRIGSCVFGER
ncbi:MAG: YggS family pyridoxal phosphate enzyme [Bacteroidetes bacterium RIFCSPLOWO2_12_FULL_37_12]|nr:MAG: YggS family pyridoxal phosphate enzyme [Bacteroidetes bacterium RIFCSPLOWO2_12_FULL_37_12]